MLSWLVFSFSQARGARRCKFARQIRLALFIFMFTFWNTVVSWFFFLAGAQSKTSQHRETDSKLAALETLPESQFEMEGGVFQRFEIGVLTTSNVDRIYRVRSHWEVRDIHCLLWVRDQIGIRTTSTVGHTHDEYCGPHVPRAESLRSSWHSCSTLSSWRNWNAHDE